VGVQESEIVLWKGKVVNVYKCLLCNAEDLDDILDAINEKALRVVSCFYISDLRQICIMTEEDDRQPIVEIIKVRKQDKAERKRRPPQKR